MKTISSSENTDSSPAASGESESIKNDDLLNTRLAIVPHDLEQQSLLSRVKSFEYAIVIDQLRITLTTAWQLSSSDEQLPDDCTSTLMISGACRESGRCEVGWQEFGEL